MLPADEKRPSWLDRSIFSALTLNWETVIFALILIAAIGTRFYLLEPRVMSHDETSHTYFSWLLFKGQGYRHDPVTHGPLQFHLVALSYFLFGDSDTSARIPAVLFSIATVAFLWNYRRYLGRAGALIAAALFVISPYMLYYGRYVRNEAFVALFGVMTIWAILRYQETGQSRYLLWLTAATVLHYTAKETSYIYTAQVLVFLGLYFVFSILQRQWPDMEARTRFLLSLLAGVGFAALGVLLMILDKKLRTPTGADATVPAVPGQNLANAFPGIPSFIPLLIFGLGGVALLAAIAFLVKGHLAGREDAEKQFVKFILAFLLIPGLLALAIPYAGLIGQYPAIQNLSATVAEGTPPAQAASPFLIAGLMIPSILLGAGLLAAGWYTMKVVVLIFPPDRERSFDMLVVVGSIILPTLTAFFVKPIGNPIDYTTAGIIKSTMVLIPVCMLAIGVGLGWNIRLWLTNAALFYGIFIVFYTTIFTNGSGFATGMLGSLGYWLEQQGVNRGTQPWYYYLLVQIPMYEYLPALGSLLAAGLLLRRKWSVISGRLATGSVIAIERTAEGLETPPTVALLGLWAVTSLVAFSYAGEKMPWLTVHITLPMLLLAGWALGALVETTDWAALWAKRGLLVILVLPVFFFSLLSTLGAFLGPNLPFQGKSLVQLEATGTFITSLITAVISGWGLYYLLKTWQFAQIGRLVTFGAFTLLGVLTARAAFMASYINYDRATEYLVYAHCAPGIKIALAQIEELSKRTTGGLDMVVAYDNDTTYPYWWYLRNYPNLRYYAANPTRDLRDAPVILVGDTNYSKIEPVVAKGYNEFDYIRIWWPNEDYKDLTWDRIKYMLFTPEARSALFKIWLNRDYTQYASLFGKTDMTLDKWSPAGRMRLYIRKDMVAKVWNYGAVPAAEAATIDPYLANQIKDLTADRIIGIPGTEAGQFQNPRAIAIGADNTLYIADTGNHRIQHLDAEGHVLQTWGSFADLSKGPAPMGTFNEPWGIAVGPDGSVYVADTWNHRIQKFTADGKPITMWGYGINQTEDPLGFYGPRGIAVDGKGRVFVTDTGNKRVVVFDSDGKPITQFGGPGLETGKFDEPMGIFADAVGVIYVADTWNQRVQVFNADTNGNFVPLLQWDIAGWYGKSLNNYPYIAANIADNRVFVTDPESNRIIEFTTLGKFVRFWGDVGSDAKGVNLPTGLTVDANGGVWVVDTGNNRILHFTLPPEP